MVLRENFEGLPATIQQRIHDDKNFCAEKFDLLQPTCIQLKDAVLQYNQHCETINSGNVPEDEKQRYLITCMPGIKQTKLYTMNLSRVAYKAAGNSISWHVLYLKSVKALPKGWADLTRRKNNMYTFI